MLLASFLANDAAASFDERRLPPATKRGQVQARAVLGPSKKFWRFARRANFNDREAARSCCEPSRDLTPWSAGGPAGTRNGDPGRPLRQ
jgi:hypothetical protein